MDNHDNDDTSKHCHHRSTKQNVILVMGASGRIGVRLIKELSKYKRRPFATAPTTNDGRQQQQQKQQDENQIIPTVVCGFCKDPTKLDRTTKFHCGKIIQGDALNHSDVKHALLQTKANIVAVAIGDNNNNSNHQQCDTTTAAPSNNIRTETAKVLENVLVSDPELFQHIQIVVISRADGRDTTSRRRAAEEASVTQSSNTPSRFSNAMNRFQDYRRARRAAATAAESDGTTSTTSRSSLSPPKKETNHRNEIATLLGAYRMNHILSDHAGQEAVFTKSPTLCHRTVIVRPALSNPNTKLGMVGGLLLSYVRDSPSGGSSTAGNGSSSGDDFYNCHFVTEWMAKKLCTVDGLGCGTSRRKKTNIKLSTNKEHDDDLDDDSNKTSPLDDSSTENSVDSYDENDEEDHKQEDLEINNNVTGTKNQGTIIHSVWGPQGWQYYTRIQASKLQA